MEGRGGLKRTRLALGGGLSGGCARLAAWLRRCSALLALSIRMGMGEAATGLCVLSRNPPMDCRWGSDCLSKMDGPRNGSSRLQKHICHCQFSTCQSLIPIYIFLQTMSVPKMQRRLRVLPNAAWLLSSGKCK